MSGTGSPALVALAAIYPVTQQPYSTPGPFTFFTPPLSSVNTRFIYRPTNDPVNPGWTSLPGAVSQMDDARQTANGVADALAAFRAFVPPAGVDSEA